VIRTQIQLTETQAREVKRMAEERGVSMAAIIREAIDDRLRRRNAPSWDELVERAIAAIGCGHSGLGDLAERHDHYFADSIADPMDD
jgi:16S rRNA U516 pseudouridylate synthase RsuA-like enzyme